jgi:hypothetical protein
LPAIHAPGAAPAGAVLQRFALRPGDVTSDRETPALTVAPDGTIVLAWASQANVGDNVRTLYVARSTDGGTTFAAPVAVRSVPIYRYTSGRSSRSPERTMAFSTHVLPRLVVAGDSVVLGWVEAIDGGPTVKFFVARSRDGGKSFSEPIPVHGKDASKPGFTTLTVATDGTLVAAWLDGRNQGQQPFFAARPMGSEGFEPERLVFAGPEGQGICPCCDLAAVRMPDGSDLVAFRNSDSGHRDIWFARAPGGAAFGPPAPLSPDNWTFEGCPHDGPSLALDRDGLCAVWMSAHTGRNRVYVARTPLSDLAWTPRELSPSTPGAQGHPKLATAGAGKLYAVWDESLDAAGGAPASKTGHGAGYGHGPALSGSGRAVMLAATTDGSSRFRSASPVAPRPGVFQLNPAIAVAPDGAVLVAWNEIDTAGKRVVIIRQEPEEKRP